MTVEHTLGDLLHKVRPERPERQIVGCPHCGFEDGLHLGDARTYHQRSDDYDELNPLGTRGPWVSIPLWCETCRHRTQLVVSFHKGTVGFAAVPYLGRVVWLEEESDTHFGR
jgi:hypothetical protein